VVAKDLVLSSDLSDWVLVQVLGLKDLPETGSIASNQTSASKSNRVVRFACSFCIGLSASSVVI
jgi:hypothetical protein